MQDIASKVSNGQMAHFSNCCGRGLEQVASEASDGQVTNFSCGNIAMGGMAIVTEQSEKSTVSITQVN